MKNILLYAFFLSCAINLSANQDCWTRSIETLGNISFNSDISSQESSHYVITKNIQNLLENSDCACLLIDDFLTTTSKLTEQNLTIGLFLLSIPAQEYPCKTSNSFSEIPTILKNGSVSTVGLLRRRKTIVTHLSTSAQTDFLSYLNSELLYAIKSDNYDAELVILGASFLEEHYESIEVEKVPLLPKYLELIEDDKINQLNPFPPNRHDSISLDHFAKIMEYYSTDSLRQYYLESFPRSISPREWSVVNNIISTDVMALNSSKPIDLVNTSSLLQNLWKQSTPKQREDLFVRMVFGYRHISPNLPDELHKKYTEFILAVLNLEGASEIEDYEILKNEIITLSQRTK
ncbi:MAG: hypothetical protein SFY68_04640 [Candidatus Sumerlaeia bacterium]|nr:hypothetical protein [Candidatus Sumerlaeia bacterium]